MPTQDTRLKRLPKIKAAGLPANHSLASGKADRRSLRPAFLLHRSPVSNCILVSQSSSSKASPNGRGSKVENCSRPKSFNLATAALAEGLSRRKDCDRCDRGKPDGYQLERAGEVAAA